MPRSCSSSNKKKAKLVKNCKGNMVCVRYGDKNMSIKKHIPARKKSFCARHRCHLKTNPATPGFQSCKAWNCKTGKICKGSKTSSKKYRGRKTSKGRSANSLKKCKKGQVRSRTTNRCRKIHTTRKSSKRRSKPKNSSSRGKKYVSKSGRVYTKCWSGYKRSGWKRKNGRIVPNCIKN